jgi:hypothetical protein
MPAWLKYLTRILSKPSPANTELRPPRIELPAGSIPEQWRAWHALQPGGWAALLTNDPFLQWRPEFSHAAMVESNLEFALTLKYVDKDPELCEQFLDRALAIAERMRIEIDSWKHSGPDEQMRLERAEAYARWIRTGALDRDRLRTAYGYAMLAAGEVVYDDWDDDDYDPEGARLANAFVKEGALLAAARLALLAGDYAMCDEALNHFRAPGQSFHCKMRDALATASAAIAARSATLLDAAQEPIAELLDVLRPVQPTVEHFWGARLAAFEVAAIQASLHTPEPGPPGLDRVYAAIMAE